MRIPCTQDRTGVEVHNPVAMISCTSAVWRGKNVDAINPLGAETACNGSPPTVVACRSLKTIRIPKSLRHVEISISKAAREQTSVCIVVDVHKQDDLISSSFPLKELFDQVFRKGRMW